MAFIAAELIKKKRSGLEHSADEIHFMVDTFVSGELPDYQMAAWLMAIYFRDMTKRETATLTEVMINSGKRLDFSHLGVAVDKHSTGGVGDKATMILAPIAAAAGVHVPMMAGRGLGHTGGTLDKLEAIPGFRIGLSLEEFSKQVEKIGVAIIGQGQEICPADGKIYALRDVTATVESLPLICASIMSKKLAEGLGALVLDVKFGNGAFMKTVEDADTLAEKLIDIGRAHGKRVVALLTSMEQPLGRFIGNGLEISECLAVLQSRPFLGVPSTDFDDIRDLSLHLAGEMIYLSGKAATPEKGLKIARETLESGRAWTKFVEMCKAQDGDLEKIAMATHQRQVLATSSGFVSQLNTESIGYAALALGAGRIKTSDRVDPTAGIQIHRKIGESVKSGEVLYTLFANGKEKFAAAEGRLLSATTISLQKSEAPGLISKRREG